MEIIQTIAPNCRLQMDEEIHERAKSYSVACPSAGPTSTIKTTTSGRFEKLHSTLGCDEYPTPPQMGQYQNPSPNQPRNLDDNNILLANKEKILLQTCGCQYDVPPESTPTTLELAPAAVGKPLMITCPKIEPNPRIPRMSLQQNIHNPHSRAAHSYSMVDDLA